MKKYYINVWISVYANSAEEANEEVRQCLNTGKGHIHEYELSEVVDSSLKTKLPPCEWCGHE